MTDVAALERAASRLNALADDPAGLAALLTPQAARTLAVVFQQLAFMGGHDGGHLHRVGVPLLVRLARILCGENAGDETEETL